MPAKTAKTQGSRHFLHVEKRSDGVALVWLDASDESYNLIRADFQSELNAVLDELEPTSDVRAVVFASRKDDFLLGSDLQAVLACTSEREAEELARDTRACMQRLATYSKPTVAAIRGQALGAGLELALACKGRIAAKDAHTFMGLPEVALGLLPGAGGTQRLPRLVGLQHALDLLLTGHSINGKDALAMNLVDDLCLDAMLVQVACERAIALANGEHSRSGKKGFRRYLHTDVILDAVLEDTPLGRRVLFDRAENQVLERTHGNYPAPKRIIDVLRAGIDHGFEAGLDAESKAFGELAVSPHARELIQLFLARQEIKRQSLANGKNVEARPIHRLGVVGAGLMGTGIAYLAVTKARTPVRLRDNDEESLRQALQSIHSMLNSRVRKGRLAPHQAEIEKFQITTTADYSGFGHCDLVIEAAAEDLHVKRQILKDIEDHGHDSTIFASNTSTLPIAKIAEGCQRPENVIGMHYFSPAQGVPLVELVPTEQTAPWVISTCADFAKKQGKTVLVVQDGVGFYTCRVMAPLLNEAVRMVTEGVPIEEIDDAMATFGFPMGPIRLLDAVGVDIAEKSAAILYEAFGDRMAPPPGIHALVQNERRGQKNNHGFYHADRKRGVDSSVYEVLGVSPQAHRYSADEIAWRCTLLLLNEAVRCFAEKIVRDARDGDVAAVLGLGFPPFRGGPFRFMDAMGPKDIVRRLERMQRQYGSRFAPAKHLVEMAESGSRFHISGKPSPRGPSRRRQEGVESQPPMPA